MDAGEVIQGRYELQEPIGEGGMAAVWRARDRRLDRSVAVKLLSARLSDDPDFLVRFFSEAQSIAAISHAHVIGVLDFGRHAARPYLVTEYLPGGSLAALAGRPLKPADAVRLVAQAARGAGAAHARGIIHRDVKPANILLDETGHVKLADFGIASSAAAERLTATGTAIGSPHYISPEQIAGGGATPRSDVYSLGVVLYELITGVKPFDADNLTAIAIAHVEQEPVPPSAHVASIDPALEQLILRCLEKDAGKRFPDGDALAAALDEVASGGEKTIRRGALHDDDDDAEHEGDDEERAGIRRTLIAAIIAALLIAGGSAAALEALGAFDVVSTVEQQRP